MIQNELMAIICVIVGFASMCLCSIFYHLGKSKGREDGFREGVMAERTANKIDKSNREEFEEIFGGLK